LKIGLAARIVWRFLWGKRGLDIRCRMLAADRLLAEHPNADNEEVRAFVLGLLPLDLGYRLPVVADLISLVIGGGLIVAAPSWLVSGWLHKQSLGSEATSLVVLVLQWLSFYGVVAVLAALAVAGYAAYDYSRRLTAAS